MMGCIFRIFLVLFAACLAVVILFVGGSWLVGKYAPSQAARYIERKTGSPTTLESARLNPFEGTVRLGGLRIENPPDFGDGDLLILDELLVDFDVSGLRTRTLTFSAIRLDIERFGYVERGDGTSNWDEFFDQLPVRAPEDPPETVPGVTEDAPDYTIETLYLRVGEVVVYPARDDRSLDAREPRVVRLDKVLEAENVTDLPAKLEAFAEEIREAGAPGPLRFLRGWRLAVSGIPEEGARAVEGVREAIGDLLPGVGNDDAADE